MVDAERVIAYITALTNKFENKQANKKDNISGDFTNDSVSYPTVNAVKTWVNNIKTTLEDAIGLKEDAANKVTSINSNSTDTMYPSAKLVYDELLLKENLANKVTAFQNTPDNTHYPSEKLVKDNLDLKVNISDVKDNLTSTDTNKPLSANQGKVLSDAIAAANTNLEIGITKQATADTGYASTYVISQGGVALSPKIQIEKDKMLRSISVETVGATPTADESAKHMVEGDQYILMVVNTVDNDGTTNLILPITDVFDLQRADETTLTLNSNGVFSIKNGGVDTAQLKDSAVTTAKINAKAVTKAKLADEVSEQWISDADTEIDAYLDAITAALTA